MKNNDTGSYGTIFYYGGSDQYTPYNGIGIVYTSQGFPLIYIDNHAIRYILHIRKITYLRVIDKTRSITYFAVFLLIVLPFGIL